VILSLETTAATSGTRRFYFHLEFKGHVLRDRRGEELASRIAARERGFAIARAIVGRRGTGRLDPEVCVLKVADDHSTWLTIEVADWARNARSRDATARSTAPRGAGRKPAAQLKSRAG
jgi:hypothetical protein